TFGSPGTPVTASTLPPRNGPTCRQRMPLKSFSSIRAANEAGGCAPGLAAAGLAVEGGCAGFPAGVFTHLSSEVWGAGLGDCAKQRDEKRISRAKIARLLKLMLRVTPQVSSKWESSYAFR